MKSEKTNGQTGGEGGEAEITNTVGRDFGMYHRLMLMIALKIGNREEGEIFTAGNTAMLI